MIRSRQGCRKGMGGACALLLALGLMPGARLRADENEWLVPLGLPPQAAPKRISGGEGFPPLPLPAPFVTRLLLETVTSALPFGEAMMASPVPPRMLESATDTFPAALIKPPMEPSKVAFLMSAAPATAIMAGPAVPVMVVVAVPLPLTVRFP